MKNYPHKYSLKVTGPDGECSYFPTLAWPISKSTVMFSAVDIHLSGPIRKQQFPSNGLSVVIIGRANDPLALECLIRYQLC